MANLVQFKRALMFCLRDWGRDWASWAPLSTPLNIPDAAVRNKT